MKVLSICILRKGPKGTDPVILAGEQNVASFGFFTRSSVQQFLIFTSKTLLQRAQPGMRETCLHQDYMCHYYVQSNGLGAIVIADDQYPKRVAFHIMADLLGKFTNRFVNRGVNWQSPKVDNTFLKSFPELPEMLKKCQNPEDCDKITKIHKEIDATKEVLHNTIDSVLERGVKLDHLVQKSDDLSTQSKAFYKSAADTNKCCIVM